MNINILSDLNRQGENVHGWAALTIAKVEICFSIRNVGGKRNNVYGLLTSSCLKITIKHENMMIFMELPGASRLSPFCLSGLMTILS